VSANTLEKFEVVWVAVEFTLILVTISTPKLTSTFFATVMLRVHSLPLDSDVLSYNGFLALSAYARCGIYDDGTCGLAYQTIGLSFILFVWLAAKLCTTSGTIKALRVIHLPNGVDALIGNGFQAGSTLGTKEVVEVIITIWFPILFYKVA